MIDNSDFAAIELLSSIEISVAELLTFYLVNFSYLSGELFLTCAPIHWFQWWVNWSDVSIFSEAFSTIYFWVPSYMTHGASLYDSRCQLIWRILVSETPVTTSLPIWWTFPAYLVNSSCLSGEVPHSWTISRKLQNNRGKRLKNSQRISNEFRKDLELASPRQFDEDLA